MMELGEYMNSPHGELPDTVAAKWYVPLTSIGKNLCAMAGLQSTNAFLHIQSFVELAMCLLTRL